MRVSRQHQANIPGHFWKRVRTVAQHDWNAGELAQSGNSSAHVRMSGEIIIQSPDRQGSDHLCAVVQDNNTDSSQFLTRKVRIAPMFMVTQNCHN